MVLLILVVAFCSRCEAQTAAQPKKHLLVVGEEKGYRHDAVSHAIATIERLGRETGLWTTTIRTDTEVLTKKKLEYNAKNLNDFDAVLFYTGGELEMNPEQKAAFLSFVRPRRWKRFYRRAQRYDHLYELAGVRRNDWRILRRTSLGHF